MVGFYHILNSCSLLLPSSPLLPSTGFCGELGFGFGGQSIKRSSLATGVIFSKNTWYLCFKFIVVVSSSNCVSFYIYTCHVHINVYMYHIHVSLPAIYLVIAHPCVFLFHIFQYVEISGLSVMRFRVHWYFLRQWTWIVLSHGWIALLETFPGGCFLQTHVYFPCVGYRTCGSSPQESVVLQNSFPC